MNGQTEALIELDEHLRKSDIPYAVIGGIAIQRWGEPRFTKGVDITIVAGIGEEENICRKIAEKFPLRLPDGIEYALKNRILLVSSANGCPIDISIGFLDYEKQVIERSVEFEIAEGRKVPVCSPEDLIVFKLISGRSRDIEDVCGILIRQKGTLDIEYV